MRGRTCGWPRRRRAGTLNLLQQGHHQHRRNGVQHQRPQVLPGRPWVSRARPVRGEPAAAVLIDVHWRRRRAKLPQRAHQNTDKVSRRPCIIQSNAATCRHTHMVVRQSHRSVLACGHQGSSSTGHRHADRQARTCSVKVKVPSVPAGVQEPGTMMPGPAARMRQPGAQGSGE